MSLCLKITPSTASALAARASGAHVATPWKPAPSTRPGASSARANRLAGNAEHRVWSGAHLPTDARRTGEHPLDARARHVRPSNVCVKRLPIGDGRTHRAQRRVARRPEQHADHDRRRADDLRQVRENQWKLRLHAQANRQGTTLFAMAHGSRGRNDDRVSDHDAPSEPGRTLRAEHVHQRTGLSPSTRGLRHGHPNRNARLHQPRTQGPLRTQLWRVHGSGRCMWRFASAWTGYASGTTSSAISAVFASSAATHAPATARTLYSAGTPGSSGASASSASSSSATGATTVIFACSLEPAPCDPP
jgi:hypothetical protein